MKKLLALVLALVMSLSLVTISSADFKDADKIDYTEAVDVMNAAGVLIGDENGNFNPKENLTRAQAAKIISYLLLGNKTAEGLAGSGKFTDVAKTSWAAGFVDYCAAVGVVNGVGNGLFDPNGSLTTLQFAKMLLVSLGYDAKIEGFVGSDWSINVSAKANQVGLLSGLDVSANAALTREQAAKMTLNTLKSPLVEYDTKGTTVTVGGDASVTVGASKAEFKTSTNKKAQTISNAVINGTTAYTVEFAEEYYPDLKLNSDTTDDFGRPCVEWFWKADSIGVYSNSDDLVATYTEEVTAADIYTAVGKSVSDDVNSGKAKLTTFIDGVGNVVKATDAKGYVTKNDSTTVNGTGNGDLTEVYVNDDNDVTIVTVRTYVFQATTDYNAKKDTVTLTSAGDTSILLDNATLDGDDFDIKDIKADDYILVTASTDGKSNKYTVQSADVAEVISGEVTGYKVNSNVTVGGTTYKYSSTTVKNSADTRNTQYTVGQNAAVVLDKYGYIIAVDKAVVSSNYVYVSEFAQPSGLSNGKVVASAYFTDGTTADITVKERQGVTNKSGIIGGSKTANAGWYTYSSNSANEYSLYNVESKYTQAPAYSFSGNNKVVMYNDKVSFVDGQTLYANNDTIVIVDDGDSVSVYTGVKNIPDIKLTSASSTATINALAKSNNYAYYVFVRVNGSASIAGNEDSALVYYVKYDGTHKTTDNKIYYTYKVLDANGKEEVVKADTMLGNLNNGDIYAVYNKTRMNSDDEITSVDAITEGGKYIAGTSAADAALIYTAGALTLDKNGTKMHYTLADDAKITLVVKKSANALNKDHAADYEATVGMTGKTLGDTLKEYKLTYSYAGKVTDNLGSVISELFVTVDAAKYTAGGENNNGGSFSDKAATVNVADTYRVGQDVIFNLTAKRADFIPDGANLTVYYDVYYNNVKIDSATHAFSNVTTDSVKAVVTKNISIAGLAGTHGADVRVDVTKVETNKVIVKYVDKNGNAIANSAFVTAGSATDFVANVSATSLKYKLDSTDTSTTVKATVTQLDKDGKTVTLLAESTGNNANAGETLTTAAVVGTSAVTVKLNKALSDLTESYSFTNMTATALSSLDVTGKPAGTHYAGLGDAIQVVVTASKTSNIGYNESIGLEIKANAVLNNTDKPVKITLNIGGEDFELVCVNDGTTVGKTEETVKITGKVDATKATVTKVEALPMPTATFSVVDKLGNGFIDVQTGAVDEIVVTFSEKQTTAPTLTDGTTLEVDGTHGVLAADGMSATYKVTAGLADANATDTLTIDAGELKGANGCVNNAITANVKGLSITVA